MIFALARASSIKKKKEEKKQLRSIRGIFWGLGGKKAFEGDFLGDFFEQLIPCGCKGDRILGGKRGFF